MRRKKVFLFVFLIVLFFGFLNPSETFAWGNIPTQRDSDGNVLNPATGNLAPDAANFPAPNQEDEPALASRITTGVISGLINVVSPLIAFIAVITAWIAGIFVNIGVELLRISLEIGITNLSIILSDKGVKTLWEIFRNLGNISLVFILLYIAITTIFQTAGNTKKLLSNVIIAAVLMNFSFFFGAIIVDVSNVAALNIYREINESKEIKEAGNVGNYINDKASSAIVAQQFGIAKNKENAAPGAPESGPGEGSVAGAEESWFSQQLKKAVGYVMLTILDIVLAIVLIIAAFSVIGRMIAIILLLLVSPLAFIGMILPKTESWSSDWWKSIIGQSFYLPVFLLFVYVGIKAIEVISTIQPMEQAAGKDITNLSQTITVIAPIIVQFAIVIGIFIAALTAANKISSQGSQIVNKIAGSVKSKVAGATIGGAALLGRNTVGYGLQRFADSDLGKKIGSTRTGSLVLSGARKAGKSSFDLRGSSAFSGVASATGIGEKAFGTAQVGGFAEQEKKAIQRREQYARSINIETSREDILQENPASIQTERVAQTTSEAARDQARVARDQANQTLQAAINRGLPRAAIANHQAQLAAAETTLAGAENTLTQAVGALNRVVDNERNQRNPAMRYVQRLEGAPTDPNNITARDRLRQAGSWVTGRHSNTEAASRARRYLTRDQAARDREALAAAIRAANNP